MVDLVRPLRRLARGALVVGLVCVAAPAAYVALAAGLGALILSLDA